MGRSNIYSGGTGDKINGIIQDYVVASGGNVNAGDFVTYIQNLSILKNDIDSDNNIGTSAIKAVALNSKKILILYQYRHSSTYYLYVKLITINDDDTLTISSKTALYSFYQYQHSNTSMVKINDTQILVSSTQLSTYSSNQDGPTQAVIINIDNNDNITVSSVTELITQKFNNVSNLKALENNKVFFMYSRADTYGGTLKTYGEIITINSNNTITRGTAVELTSSSSVNILSLNDNLLYAGFNVVQINNNSITIKQTNNETLHTSALLVNNNYILSFTSSNYYLTGKIYSIEPNYTINLLNTIQLSSLAYSAMSVKALTLTSNELFITHSVRTSDGDDILYGLSLLLAIDNNYMLIPKDDLQISNTDDSSIHTSLLLQNNKVFVYYWGRRSRYTITASIISLSGGLVKATSLNSIIRYI